MTDSPTKADAKTSKAVASNLEPQETQADKDARAARDEAVTARAKAYGDKDAEKRLRAQLDRQDERARTPLPSMAAAVETTES